MPLIRLHYRVLRYLYYNPIHHYSRARKHHGFPDLWRTEQEHVVDFLAPLHGSDHISIQYLLYLSVADDLFPLGLLVDHRRRSLELFGRIINAYVRGT